MHEFSLAQSIVETVLGVAQDHHVRKIFKIHLEVGEVALVNLEQLKWHVGMLTKDTIAEHMMIETTTVPVEIHCLSCGYRGGVTYHKTDPAWHASAPMFGCVVCDSTRTVITSGRELNIKDMNAATADEHERERRQDA